MTNNTNLQDCFSFHELISSVFKNVRKTGIRRTFMEEYPSFFSYLKQLIPQLTRGDEILFVLIILGFSAEDVAALQGVSRRSVNMARYRLRMRMKLLPDQGLDEAVKDIFRSYVANI